MPTFVNWTLSRSSGELVAGTGGTEVESKIVAL
jgi:hypothetical protein